MYFVLIGFAIGGLFARSANRIGKSTLLWGLVGGFTFLIVAFLFEFLVGLIEAGLFPTLSPMQQVIIALVMGAVMGLMICLLLGVRFLRGAATYEPNP